MLRCHAFSTCKYGNSLPWDESKTLPRKVCDSFLFENVYIAKHLNHQQHRSERVQSRMLIVVHQLSVCWLWATFIYKTKQIYPKYFSVDAYDASWFIHMCTMDITRVLGEYTVIFPITLFKDAFSYPVSNVSVFYVRILKVCILCLKLLRGNFSKGRGKPWKPQSEQNVSREG
jgi:hypothetical protein